MSITYKVRNAIPKILKKSKRRLSFNELFEKLKEEEFGAELVNDSGEDRTGILRGIINKLEAKPIPNLGIEKRGSNVYYVYISSELSQLELVVQNFLDEVKNQKLLTANILDFSIEERTQFLKYQDLISKLYDLSNKQD